MRISRSQGDSFPRFAYVKDDIYTVDSLCFFTGQDIKILNDVLNSNYAAYYFLMNVAILDNGGVQMRQQYVENIPIPHIMSGQDIYEAFNFTSSEIQFIEYFVKKTITSIQSN